MDCRKDELNAAIAQALLVPFAMLFLISGLALGVAASTPVLAHLFPGVRICFIVAFAASGYALTVALDCQRKA